MNTYERMKAMFEHRTADRIPFVDDPWDTTVARWHREGMPEDEDWIDHFGLDRVISIEVDNSPQYPEAILEETNRYKVHTTKWGATKRDWKYETSTPEFLDFTITSYDRWLKAKERMKATPDRIDWKNLEDNYDTWKEKGYWIQGITWFGFDVTHAGSVGTERVLTAFALEPHWMQDMFSTYLELSIELHEMIHDAGYEYHAVRWYDDMGYKNNQFFSTKMYGEVLQPYHRRAIEWAHSKNYYACLHSCGNVNPFIPLLVDMGLDMINPLEVKAGMDPVALKQEFGDRLVFHGGINAVNWDKPELIKEEIERVVPAMKENGGFIFASDHSIPSSVSYDDFSSIVDLVKEHGAY